MDINGKVVVITGASTGIGLATARLFAQHGARLALIARSADKLERLAAELPDAFAAPADLTDIPAIPGLFSRIEDHFGRIDALINNAGRGFHVSIEKADIELFRSLLDLNVVSVLSAMQCVIPIMRRQGGGVIVNISSGLSKRIVPGVGPYASTKYALNALTLTARQELEPDHIRVGLMIPGLTANTEFAANAYSVKDRPDWRRNASLGDSVEHVAEKILEAVQTEAAEIYANSSRPRE